MKNITKIATFLTTLTIFFSLAAQADQPTIEINCRLPGFGVTFSFKGKLSESNPELNLEKYTMDGFTHFEDTNRPNPEFQDFWTSGAFDVTKGVMRFSLRPNVPLFFGIFDSIHFIQLKNGHQLVNISSTDLNHGPNGGTSGQPCKVAKSL